MTVDKNDCFFGLSVKEFEAQKKLADEIITEIIFEEEEERRIVARMKAAANEMAEADASVGAWFRPQIQACLSGGDLDGAKDILKRVPDCVERVFMMDAIRCYEQKDKK